MKTLFNGFDSNEATFIASDTVVPGRAVALKSNGKIEYPASDRNFTGIATSCRDDVISVVVRGYAVASFRNSLPQVGICKLAPDESGYMEADDANGKPYTVLSVDTRNNTIEFIL